MKLYTATMTMSNGTCSTMNNLTQMYYFTITVYNGAGESAPSNKVSKTIQ